MIICARSAFSMLSIFVFTIILGCSSAEEQLRIACNTGNLSMKAGKYEGRIWNIKVHKDSKGGFSAFQLSCQDGTHFSFDWIGGDLSKAEPLSTAVVTVKDGIVTDVSIKNRWFEVIFSLLMYVFVGLMTILIIAVVRNRDVRDSIIERLKGTRGS